MGAFFLVKKTRDRIVKKVCASIRVEMAKQGFDVPVILQVNEYHLYVYKKLMQGGPQIWKQDENSFCLATGTLIYKGYTGEIALRQFYQDFSYKNIKYDRLYGAFCIVVRKGAKTYLLIDRLGIYKVYHDKLYTIFSSSFIALASAINDCKINSQCVYEYVFQGAVYGSKTVLKNIELVSSDCTYEIGEEVKTHSNKPIFNNLEATGSSVEELLNCNLENLRKYYSHIYKCFGSHVDTALSGGYDSRLTLALLWDQGIKPNVYVYGKKTDSDVQIACLIDKGEKIGLMHIDKSTFPEITQSQLQDVVKENYYVFDGYPTDGIFGNGSDLITRKERCQYGQLMLNGGGGEIFRNFFYLPNFSYSVRQLIWTFYCRYDPAVCASFFDEDYYQGALIQKVKDTLEIKRNKLTRIEIEMLYSIFRCRYWMGRNNSINNRLGFSLTPFIDYNIVRGAICIPLSDKNFGQFEAKMIHKVNPKLASYMSDYQHDFTGGPTLFHRLKDVATHIRPPWLRRYSYRMQASRRVENYPYFLTKDYLASVFDYSFPYMTKFFKVDKFTDTAQFNRLCTLEYMFQKLKPVIS